jgi:hypothetical protein
MRKQYLHVRAYSCDNCKEPVICGWTGVRENEICGETDVREVGAICLSCGHRQDKASDPGFTRDFPPVLWDFEKSINVESLGQPAFSQS